MYQPDELKSEEPLFWSPGRGTDVWATLVAARSGDLPALQRLVAADPSLARCRYEYHVPLMFAVMEPNRGSWLGVTPLHHFAEYGDVENSALHIDRGADLHARDDDFRSTPLAWAARTGQRAMVDLLLACGARPDLPDDPTWATPPAWARRLGHAEIVDLLRRNGAG